MSERCRCGYDAHEPGQPHPCHGKGYACRKPAKRRFVPNPRASLAGMQMKMAGYITFACDECWEEFGRRAKL